MTAKTTPEKLKTDHAFCLVVQEVMKFSDDGLASMPTDYLADLVKSIGDYQDYCSQMAKLAEASMVRIKSLMTAKANLY